MNIDNLDLNFLLEGNTVNEAEIPGWDALNDPVDAWPWPNNQSPVDPWGNPMPDGWYWDGEWPNGYYWGPGGQTIPATSPIPQVVRPVRFTPNLFDPDVWHPNIRPGGVGNRPKPKPNLPGPL
jgi:hypothetical protein